MPVARSFFFFFNDTATTEIYTLSLHDALPISGNRHDHQLRDAIARLDGEGLAATVPDADQQRALVVGVDQDRKSTRLNSSHSQISYAVFCLKKKTITACSATTVSSPPIRVLQS